MRSCLCYYEKNLNPYHRKWKKEMVRVACGHVYMAVKDSYTVAELQGLKK